MSKLSLITVNGVDKPGITAKLMQQLQNHDVQIKDMGQNITHGLLSLSFLIEHSPDSGVLKDLVFEAKELGMQLDYQEVTAHSNPNFFETYSINCVAQNRIEPSFMKELTQVLASHSINIKRIENLDPLDFKSLELLVEWDPKLEKFDKIKPELLALSHNYALDIALIKDNVWRRNKRLIVFDMDSTLIQSEVIVEMAKAHGVGDKVHQITERAMNGELDFDQSLTERVALLKGLNVTKLEGILKDIKLTEGVEQFLKTVQKLGYKTAIISGGFLHFAKYFQKQLGIDYAFANDLEIKDQLLTGAIKGEIINAKQKAILLEMLAQQEGINLEQVVAIGDGANDLPMLSKAGLGIAFHAKDIVKKEAKQHMSYGNMATILYFLGIPQEV